MVLGLILCLPEESGSSPALIVAAMVLLPLCSGWILFAAARRLSRSDASFAAAYRRPVLAEVGSTGLVVAGAYPTLIALVNRFFGPWTSPFGFDLTYAPLWGGLSLACLAGTLLAYPFHLWMIRRGVVRWGAEGVGPSEARFSHGVYQLGRERYVPPCLSSSDLRRLAPVVGEIPSGARLRVRRSGGRYGMEE